jgi:hypothetical protein
MQNSIVVDNYRGKSAVLNALGRYAFLPQTNAASLNSSSKSDYPPHTAAYSGGAVRQLAVIHEYADLLSALRARAETLNVSRLEIDEAAGLQTGYCGKLLAQNPLRTLSRISLGAVLGALGLVLIVAEDPAPEARARIARLAPRKRGWPGALGKQHWRERKPAAPHAPSPP